MGSRWLAIFLGLAAVAGCSSTAPRLASRTKRRAASGCARRAATETGWSFTVRIRSSPAVSEGRSWRQYVVHVPTGYVASVPTPLVLYFHGSGGSATGSDASSGWSELGDRDRFLVVYPQGLPFGQGGPTAWASAGTVDYGIDDMAFVRALLAQVESRFCVARGAVFATGMSSGGGMAGYLACDLSEQIAAAAPVAGNHYTLTKLGCRPRRPVALIEIHGTGDPVVPYWGIPASADPGWPLPSIPTWVAAWVRLDRCRPRPRERAVAPHQTLLTYTGCAPGEGVELYRLEGGGHTYPATLAGRPADAVIYRYFIEHSRGRPPS